MNNIEKEAINLIEGCGKIVNQFSKNEYTCSNKKLCPECQAKLKDDNPLSMAKYAEEYPENFKEISDTNHENTNELPVTHCPLDADHELNAESEK